MKFSFDGFGINDANDEYKTRILTFNDKTRADKYEIGRLIVAAPDLLASLELLVDYLADRELPRSMSIHVHEAYETIQKAKGK